MLSFQDAKILQIQLPKALPWASIYQAFSLKTPSLSAFLLSLSDRFIVNNPIKTVPLSPIKKNEANK